MRPYDLVIFDLDGTLADTIPDIKSAVEYSASEFGSYRISDQVMRSHITGGAFALIEGVFGDLGIRQFDLEKHTSIFLDRYTEFCDRDTYLYPHAKEVLNTLRSQSVRTALCTMKEHRPTARILAALGLEESFDAVLCGDEMLRPKPDAWPLKTLSERFGVPCGRMLMIGDGMTDLGTAENAGAVSCAVMYGYGELSSLREHSTFQISDLLEILDLVKG